ncbi:MAG: zinc metallopeptidase [Lachnospiraceae bacterium]|nr:zinc metallopeptidase [Lachnospiraceae bacterium]
MYGYYGMDWTYIMVLIGAVLCMLASARVNSAYAKYERVRAMSGMTGAQVAERILAQNGITDVTVQRVAGRLTDHYNPRTKVVNLSETTYDSPSVAAIAVAAHECGHVLQDYKNYVPLDIRTAIVPVANIGSQLGLPLVILGLIIGVFPMLVTIGIWLFSLSVLFQIITLPVEFNASRRALQMLEEYGILGQDETGSARAVLSAAALTYVAAAASSVLQLLRLILLSKRGRRN